MTRAEVRTKTAADLARLASLAARPDELDELLSTALASLRRVIEYDLAVLYELDESLLRARVAEGPLVDPRIREHTLSLDEYPTVRRALELRRPIPLEHHHHAGEEGDPYDGVLDLPHGHSCMVVPLFAQQRTIGLITLDRARCERYPDEAVELAAVYGQIVSLAMAFSQQSQLLARYRHQLKEENRLLREDLSVLSAGDRLAGSKNTQMRETVRLARQVATADLPVLVFGETGAGKEVLAHAIHGWSARADEPFVKLNCAAIPEQLVESELFGHVKGAFSGASARRAGRFWTANGGTLLLDEVGDMPLAAQSKLLRVLQEGVFEPVGSDESVRVDVRVVAATHVDLQKAVQEGRFREDLYYRLAAFPLSLPALRERREDVETIAEEMLAELAQRPNAGPWRLTKGAKEALSNYAWPGNLRQLRNVLERATILKPNGAIAAEHLGLPNDAPKRAPAALDDPNAPFPDHEANERSYFMAALQRTGGKIYGPDGAATLVGLKPTTLQSKLKKLGVSASAHR